MPQSNKAKVGEGHLPIHWRDWNAGQAQAFTRFCAGAMDEWYPGWRAEVEGVWPAITPLDRAHIQITRSGRRFWNEESLPYRGVTRARAVIRRAIPTRVRRIFKTGKMR